MIGKDASISIGPIFIPSVEHTCHTHTVPRQLVVTKERHNKNPSTTSASLLPPLYTTAIAKMDWNPPNHPNRKKKREEKKK